MSKKEKETSSATQQEETSSSAAEVNAAEETPAAVKEKKPRGRKLKYGSMSAAVMILVIAIVVQSPHEALSCKDRPYSR